MLPLLAAVPLAAFALTPAEVFEQVKDSVVVVRALNAQGKPTSQGSGVMLPSAQIATNCHVIKDSVRFQVGRGKQFFAAELRASDGEKDLCLLVALGFAARPVVLGKAAALKVGEAVYAVGSPQGLELSLSNGIVSQLRGGPPPFIQTTAAISPGSSGGGLFDAEGRLVGITTFFLQGGQSLNFAVPVEWLAEIKPGRKLAVTARSGPDWMARAVVLEEKKDWRGLLDWCRQWTRADSGNADAWKKVAWAYSRLEREADAVESYRRALQIRPSDAEGWTLLGMSYESLDRFTDAIAAHREAVRIRPDDADTWYFLGWAYESVGSSNKNKTHYSDAIAAFRRALSIKPDHLNAWYGLALAYADSGDRKAALAAVKELKRHDPAFGDRAADMLANETLFPLMVPK
jgi:tetratricopeptide (TPR) repeat protein